MPCSGKVCALKSYHPVTIVNLPESVTVKEKFLTHVKMIRKTVFRTTVIGVKSITTREKLSLTLNTKRKNEHL